MSTLLPSLKNTVATPGTFATFFPSSTDDDLFVLLADGLAEIHMYGLLSDLELDDPVAAPGGETSRYFTTAEGALIVLFAGIRLVRAELFNRVTSKHYAAAGAVYEVTQATNILRDIMAALATQKDKLLELLGTTGSASAVFSMADSYVTNVAWNYSSDWGAPLYETYAANGFGFGGTGFGN